jgi:hypothetical protein
MRVEASGMSPCKFRHMLWRFMSKDYFRQRMNIALLGASHLSVCQFLFLKPEFLAQGRAEFYQFLPVARRGTANKEEFDSPQLTRAPVS